VRKYSPSIKKMLKVSATSTKKNGDSTKQSKTARFNENNLNQSFSVNPNNFLIRRKSSCACGGSCPNCQSESDLPISHPNDASEIEADNVAKKVMRMSVGESPPRTLGGNGTLMIQAKRESGESLAENQLSKKISSSKGGNNLDENTQSFMQNRFGTDFSRVKIHNDGEAVQLSRKLNAKAFTIGNDIYFNEGQYQPNSYNGRYLLAHELAHTLQQDQGIIKRSPNDFVEVDIMTEDPAEAERLRERGIDLPSAGVVWSLLSPALIARIRGILTANGITPPAVPATAVSNPVFVLHDTAVAMSSTAITNRVNEARGPIGEGAAAYVPATGNASVARSNFFDRRRPTATEFEKGNDLVPLQTRLTNARIIWQNTNATIRQSAMRTAITGLGLTAAQVTSETTAAVNQLNSSLASTSLVFSTGMWTVNEICNQITASGIQNVVNNPANTATLQTAYDIMRPFFASRNQRLESTVNVEIVQQRGGDCSVSGPALPPYTPTQYSNTALLYLQASLQAGRFPQITTHFLVDKNAGSHCDPRCFNLTNLYQSIASLLTFSAGTGFGITPQYGTGATDNVWWSDSVCGGGHP
jgi:Domain of unknown function (DUF4157)